MVRLAIYLYLVTSSFGFLQPFLPLYMEAAGLIRREIGWVTGIGTGFALLLQPILGRLSDRFDARRPFISLCALGAGLAYTSFPHANGLGQFLVLAAIGANGTLYLNAAGGVLVGRMVTADRGGAAYANLRLWGSVGYIVTSLASGFFIGPRPGTREALDQIFRFGPIIFFLLAVIAWTVPDKRSAAGPAPRERLPISPNLRRFLIAYFLYNVALYGATSYLSLYLKSLGAKGLAITGAFAAGVVIEVMVMRWSGRFSDRYGRRPALAFSFVLLPIRMLLYMPATNPAWVFGVQMLHGINFGIVGAVAIAFANDLATDRTRGQAQARLAAVSGSATALGPILLGYVAQSAGLPMTFGAAALIAAAGAAVLVFTVEDSHSESASLTQRVPGRMRPWVGWLDAPPTRRR